MSICTSIYVWVFSQTSMISMSDFMPISYVFYYYSSVNMDGDSYSISLIIKDCVVLVFMLFHMMVRIVLSRSVKNCVKILKL